LIPTLPRRHARKSGHPGAAVTELVALARRLRRGDEEGGVGTICLICTTSLSLNKEIVYW